MSILNIILSAVFMFIGHYIKMKRWALYISVYETPNRGNLLGTLAYAQIVNAIVPIRLGEILKVVLTGRTLKNGYSLAIATMLSDLYVDFVSTVIIFALLYCYGGAREVSDIFPIYVLVFCVIILVTMIVWYYRNILKRVIRCCAGIFNETIDFYILYVTYLTIASFKDIVFRINKFRLFIYTCGLWICYYISYYMFALFLEGKGYPYTANKIFAELFSGFCLTIDAKGGGCFFIGQYF